MKMTAAVAGPPDSNQIKAIKQNSKSSFLFAILLLVIFTILLGSRSLTFPFGRDQGQYGYLGYELLKGKVIYKEVFEIKPPLTHMTHALALRIFGHSMLSIRLLDLIWQCVTAIVLMCILYLITGNLKASLPTGILYVGMYYSYGFWYTAQTDGFLILPMSLAVLLYFMAERRYFRGSVKNRPFTGRDQLLFFLAGCSAGISFLFKYSAAVALVGLLALFLIKRPWKQSFTAIAFLCCGLLLPIFLFSLYLWHHEIFTDFVAMETSYIGKYNLAGKGHGAVADMLQKFVKMWSRHWLLQLSTVLIAALLIQLRNRNRRFTLLLLTWWGATLFHLVLQNKYYEYHFLPILAPVALTFFYIGDSIFQEWKQRGARSSFGAIASIPFLLISISLIRLPAAASYKPVIDLLSDRTSLTDIYSSKQFDSGDYSLLSDSRLANYLREKTEPDDSIYIWGFEPTVNFLSERRSASRFIYNFHLYGNFNNNSMREQLMEDLRQNRPLYFVVVSNDAIPWVSGTQDDSLRGLMKFKELEHFVRSNYVHERNLDDFLVFRRTSSG